MALNGHPVITPAGNSGTDGGGNTNPGGNTNGVTSTSGSFQIFVPDFPTNTSLGTSDGEAVGIRSGYTTGTVHYQFRRRDQQGDTFTYSSDVDWTGNPNIVSINTRQIVVILPNRTEFDVRVKQNSGNYSNWIPFKTRWKKLHDSLTRLRDDSSLTATEKENRTINVTNLALSTVTSTSAGATVVNLDTGYVATQTIEDSDTGVNVINTTDYVAPKGNVTITT